MIPVPGQASVVSTVHTVDLIRDVDGGQGSSSGSVTAALPTTWFIAFFAATQCGH